MIYKNVILFLSIILLFGTVTSCCTKKQDKNSSEENFISFTEIAKGRHSNFETAKSVVINDLASYEELFKNINQTREPKLTIPTIDFENEMGIALFMGMKSSGGYSIKIDSIVSQPKELIVYTKESSSKGMTTSVLTQPYYIAKIKKTSKTIIFK